MSAEDAFLREIRTSPEDPCPRLIYADWLEERGDPRGEYLRLECELASLSPGEPAAERRERLRTLQASIDARWLARVARALPTSALTETWPLPPGFELVAELGHRSGCRVVENVVGLPEEVWMGLSPGGAVYEAWQPARQRFVALIVGETDEFTWQWQAQAEVHAGLDHPGLVKLHEAGGWARGYYLALEPAEGTCLDRDRAGTPWPAREAARLVTGVAEAAGYLHERGLAFEQLDPSNIVRTRDGIPRVFSRVVGPRPTAGEADLRGRPAYLAPERFTATILAPTPASDVYVLGVILYELLTGRAPFQGQSVAHTLAQILHTSPPPLRNLNPGVEPALEAICHRCLQKDPACRYPNGNALADDLRRFLAGQAVEADEPGPARAGLLGRVRRWFGRGT